MSPSSTRTSGGGGTGTDSPKSTPRRRGPSPPPSGWPCARRGRRSPRAAPPPSRTPGTGLLPSQLPGPSGEQIDVGGRDLLRHALVIALHAQGEIGLVLARVDERPGFSVHKS